MKNNILTVILAAGKGTRMKSALAKVQDFMSGLWSAPIALFTK
jgi:bifunctional N-acetylglucosamine-1-phosphate-uridyltransferase/glucosamine-1-phosphate-acetyltransferase GlmU-like protein